MLYLAIPARFRQLRQDPYGFAPALGELGLTVRAFAAYATIFDALVVLAFILTSALVFWGKRGDRAAVLSSLALLLMGVSLVPLVPSLYQVNSAWFVPVQLLRVAALFTSLRRRIQYFIDRRFYRRKYDAQKVLGAFSETLRDEVDLQHLTDSILEVVDETMRPAGVSLWLRDVEES